MNKFVIHLFHATFLSSTTVRALTIMPKSTYTRPGVAAAARLAALGSKSQASLWEQIDARHGEMLKEKGGAKLVKLNKFCDDLSQRLHEESSPTISKDELLQLVEWKFAKGKPRYALNNLLKSNQPATVEKCATLAFSQSQEGNIRGAMDYLCELRGVGPATASALLSLHRDDLFAFMDDEVIECLYEGKRGYTMKIYLDVNEKCTDIADTLGDDWTPRRVGRALWTAARASASGSEDLTLADASPSTTGKKKKSRGAIASKVASNELVASQDETGRRTSKRRRKK